MTKFVVTNQSVYFQLPTPPPSSGLPVTWYPGDRCEVEAVSPMVWMPPPWSFQCTLHTWRPLTFTAWVFNFTAGGRVAHARARSWLNRATCERKRMPAACWGSQRLWRAAGRGTRCAALCSQLPPPQSSAVRFSRSRQSSQSVSWSDSRAGHPANERSMLTIGTVCGCASHRLRVRGC